MEVKDKKPNIIAIIGAVILLVLAVVGLSYAFFSAYIKGSETDTSIEGTGAKLSLVYADGKSVITSSNIMPGWSATKTFTVTNNGEADTYYKLKISNITNAFVEGGLTFSISSTDGGANIDEKTVGTETRTISPSIPIKQGATHTYTVTAKYINLNTDQTPDLGKAFSYTIGIEASTTPAPIGWYDAPDGTLLAAIRNDNILKSPITAPGQEISSDTEALLASTEDDYGTSYYFRGAVKNNYVEFANKCWRIVRVNGNGSIKLTLYNDNTNNANNPCKSISSSSAYAKYSGTTYDTAFNSKENDNAYVGFMYGQTGASSYADAHANINKSTILTNLETWYTNNLASYESKLADTIWCNDKSTFITYTSGSSWGTGLGYAQNDTNYGSKNRIMGGTYQEASTSKKTPSLICPNDNNGGKLSKFTVDDTTNGNGDLTYKIGLLTADELAFSGLMYDKKNNNTYLYENAYADNGWWTLSPESFFYSIDASDYDVYFVWSYTFWQGEIRTWYNEIDAALRPAISLVSDTFISSGSGTSEDPYVVK